MTAQDKAVQALERAGEMMRLCLADPATSGPTSPPGRLPTTRGGQADLSPGTTALAR
ncbi:hypothetical protein ACINK0_17665 (plasmid) [Deinococcus sp. VB343]|uniref:Uncharacterized protein n=1 Tax=Deinococcus sp. VB142 TaxID=3112952 RepID=A0AAU6Q850_9DEIO